MASSSARRGRAGASTRPVRWLAGAHAPEWAAGRGEELELRRGRCGSAGPPGLSRGCDSQPAARLRREERKGAVGAGRRPAPGELGEERGGYGGGSRRGGGGGGGAPFLFSDPGASRTQSRNWGTRRLLGPGVGEGKGAGWRSWWGMKRGTEVQRAGLREGTGGGGSWWGLGYREEGDVNPLEPGVPRW